MRPFSTYWTKEPKSTMSVATRGWLHAATSEGLSFLKIPIQASCFAAFVWPAASTLLPRRRTVASFLEVICWLSVSSKRGLLSCEIMFLRGPPRHLTTNITASARGGQNYNTDHGTRLCQECIRMYLNLSQNIQALNGNRAEVDEAPDFNSS